MSNLIDINVFTQLVRNSGLNFADPEDIKRFEAACDEYTGDDLNRDMIQIIGNAVARKPGTELLARYNELHPLGQREPAPQPNENPQPTNLTPDKLGYEQLEKWNLEHPIGQDINFPAPRQANNNLNPNVNRSGTDLLEEYYKNNPL